ncbi:stem cell population maintenance [Mactra antiquata]
MDRESDRGSSGTCSGRCTPRSVDQELARSDTPGTSPTYQYMLDELYELEKVPASLLVPVCLEKEFIVDGIWDPEKWHRSLSGSNSGSRGGSPGPALLNDPRERRGEMIRRNSGSSANPKDRLKEEKDCIILSPQRRSFGTGCHVSQQPLLQRALSNIESDRERRDQRRIGSGRLQIDRERGRDQDYRSEREYRNERGQDRVQDRDSRDFRNERHLEKDSRDFRNVREIERDRDRDFRNPRDRFDRDDRRFDRDRMFTRRELDDRMRDNRDYHGSRYNHRRDRRDSNREEEPEWFSSGPVSKSDTIELHGFERDRRDSEKHEEQTPVVIRQEISEEVEVSDEEKPNEEGVSVVDRNGSLETNESSSPEANQSDQDIRQNKSPSTQLNQFDFNEFFNNIPGLSVPDYSYNETDNDPSSIGGSRFYQLYRQSNNRQQTTTAGSAEHSRRSSLMEDEFGYLNDLINGSKSPVIPSPPPTEAPVFDLSGFLTPFASSDKQHRLEFGTVSQKLSSNNSLVNALINNAVQERNRSSPTNMKNSPLETEAKLKALLLGRLDSTSSSGNTTPGPNSPLNVPGKVKTVAELEGELQKANRARTPPTHNERGSPHGGHNDLTAFNKLISLMQQGAATPVESPKLPVKVEPRPQSPLTHIPVQLQNPMMTSQIPGMTSQQQQQGISPFQTGIPNQQPSQQQGRIIHKPEPINLQRQMQNQRSSVSDVPFEMIDVNALASMAPLSHLGQTDASAAQKQFLEALQRNKEEQLQIRQAALKNMFNQPGSSTPGSQPLSTPKQYVTSVISPSQQNSIKGQGRRSPGDPIMSFVKAHPTIITKPASPTPPPQQQIMNFAPVQNTPRGHSPSPPLQQQQKFPVINFVPVQNTSQGPSPSQPTQQPQQIPIRNLIPVHNTPRGPSPSPLQSALLSRQAPNSPRVPSPIMFSQQPPMHLSAPSPIHPVQGGSTLSQSPQPANTNTVNTIRPPSVPRVPSPQELIVHTQAILQNALIKKQLEDQKERFYKKQQERDKTVGGPIRSSPGPILSTSTPVASKTAVNVAFTPTSVIRKMHSEKASEKEKQRRDSIEAEMNEHKEFNHDPETEQKLSDHLSSPSSKQDLSQHPNIQGMPPASIPPPSVIHGMPPPPLPNQVLPNMVTVIPGLPPFNSNQLTHLPPPPPLVSTHLPPPLLSPGAMPPPPLPQNTALVSQEQVDAVKSQQIRALIGQQSPNHSQGTSLAAVSSALPTAGRPIVKGNVVTVAMPLCSQTSIPKDLGPRAIMGGSTPVVSAVDVAKLIQGQHISASTHMINRGQTSTQYAIPITGRIPPPSAPGVGPPAPAAGMNPMYLVPGTNPIGVNHFQPFVGIQPQRMFDPRVARGPLVQTSIQNQGYSPRSLTPQINLKNGPVSPGVPVSMVTVSNSGKPENINLMKWFGNDMLKTQLPTMPPLNVQGHAQRVLTLDEIERI